MHGKFSHCFNSSLLKQNSCRNLHFFNFIDRLFHKTLSLKVNEFLPYFWVLKFGIEREIPLLIEYGIFFSLCFSQVGVSPPKKYLCYLLHWKAFQDDGKCFLFHLKSSFSSEDIWVLVYTFWSDLKNSLIRNIRLISKFMTSQIEVKTTTEWNLVN